MKRKRIMGKIALTLVMACMVVLLATATMTVGTVHNINTGMDYTSIQAAINAASAGDEIRVDSGTYYENVNVNKQLILKGIDTGAGKPVVDAYGFNNAITLGVKNITLEGFEATNATDKQNCCNAGIYLLNINETTIKNNVVRNNKDGIRLWGVSNNNTLVNNTIINNSGIGIILIGGPRDNIIANNTLKNNLCGIYAIFESNNNTIYHNDFINNTQFDKDCNAYNTGLNQWDNGKEGNFWSGYTGKDADGNGIGDTPYNISGNIGEQDKYPLMKPYNREITPNPTSTPTPLTAKITEPIPDENLKRGRTINDPVMVTFAGSVEGGSPPFTYKWYLDDSEISMQGQQVQYSINYGNHTLKLSVEDNVGTMAYSDEINFKVATTVAIVPIKLGVDSHQSSDDELIFRMIDLAVYYRQQSYGKEKVVPNLLFGWDGANKLPMTYNQYVDAYKDFCDTNKKVPCPIQSRDRTFKQIAIDAINGINLEQYNAVAIVFSSDTITENTFTPVACTSNSRYPGIGGDAETCGAMFWALIPENRISNIWVHEIGHAAFDFMDKYPCQDGATECAGNTGGNIGFWGIMGSASLSGEDQKTGIVAIGTDPLSPVDPISKRDAGWIEEDWLSIGNHQPINLINDKGIYFFDPGVAGQYKFAIEGRSPPDNVLFDSWCASGVKPCVKNEYIIYQNPITQNSEKGVLLYKYQKSFDLDVYSTHYFVDRISHIPNHNPAFKDPDRQNTVTLVPNSPSETYDDMPTGTRFHSTEENGQLYLDISKPIFSGTKVLVEDGLLEKSFGSLAGYTITQNIPDIDLKVYNSTGQMVGTNYTSGLYEIGIDGVNTSGNIQGGSEWISYPESMNDLYAVLDITPLKKWAEEVNIVLPENITVPMYMIQYDSNGLRTETNPVNITVNTENPTTIIQPEILLPPIRYINGTVIDSINKTGIAGVIVSTNTSISTITDKFGNYSLNVPAGVYKLKAKFNPRYYLNTSVIISTIDSAVVGQNIELTKKPKENIKGGVTKT